MKQFIHVLCLATMSLFSACGDTGNAPSINNSSAKETNKINHLTMTIDGKEWRAEASVSGGYHVTEALGPGILAINGQKGSGSTQQDFVINLYNTNGPGTYTINIANGSKQATHQNVAQFANLTPANYLCGGALQGSQFTIVVTKATKAPQEIEATFSGTLQCVEGNILTVTNGKFYYHE
jgi:hypothetical protein